DVAFGRDLRRGSRWELDLRRLVGRILLPPRGGKLGRPIAGAATSGEGGLERLDTGKSPIRVLREAGQDDSLQVVGQPRPEPAGRFDRLMEVRGEDRIEIGAHERGPAREQEVGERADSVDVASFINMFT